MEVLKNFQTRKSILYLKFDILDLNLSPQIETSFEQKGLLSEK